VDDVSVTLGIVVIGRNEAAHLADCLAALPDVPTVYADSASTDGSAAIAQAAGVETVVVTTPPATTASRGRNAGLARLLEIAPDTEIVQMIDGDCILDATWLPAAQIALARNPQNAAVFGQLRECHPEASLYNRLCDREWKVPAGKVMSCGGISLFRVEALQAVGGYSDDVKAGEENDLCLRLRNKGWTIEALAEPMGTHDAGLLHFGQWWWRARRAGHAFAEHIARHGRQADADWRRQRKSIFVWSGLMPLLTLLLLVASPVFAVIPIMIWCAQVGRITLREHREGESWRDAFWIGLSTMIGKFAQLLGIFDFSSRSAMRKIFGPSTR
jgi:GT2 family glycosyltransferase